MNTKSTSRRLRGVIATAVLGAVTCSLASVCVAAQPMNPPQTTVKYADLDVSKPEGATVLYARIQQAARQVCRPLEEYNFRSKAFDACVHKAIAEAVVKIDRTALFIVYNARNAQPPSIVLAATQNR